MNLSPTHHPDELLLYEYATASADLAVAYAVSAHLQFCASCRSFVATLETIGGAAFAETDSIPVSTECLDRVMAALECEERSAPLPAPLQFLSGSAALGNCCEVAHKVTRTSILAGEKPIAELIEGGPRSVLPAHTHESQEIVVILRDSYSDHAGRFAIGDFVASEPGTSHQPIADSIEGCLCYIAHNIAA